MCSRGALIPRLRFVQDVVIVILCLQHRAEFEVSELPLLFSFLQDSVQVLVLVIIARVEMTGVFRLDRRGWAWLILLLAVALKIDAVQILRFVMSAKVNIS